MIIALGVSREMASQSDAGLVFLFAMPYTFLSVAFSSLIWFWMEIAQATAKGGQFLPKFRYHLFTTWLILLGIMVGMTIAVAIAPGSMAQASEKGSALIVAFSGLLIFGFVIAGMRVIKVASVFAAMNSSSQDMLKKLYRMCVGSSVLFTIMAGFWLYTILALTNFFSNFAAVYSVYLAVELVACMFLVKSLAIALPPPAAAASASGKPKASNTHASVQSKHKSALKSGNQEAVEMKSLQ